VTKRRMPGTSGRVLRAIAMAFGLLLVISACAPPGADDDDDAVVVEDPAADDDTDEEEPADDDAVEPDEPDVDPDDEDTIRIGFIADLSGTAAASGADMVRGWDLYWEMNGTEVAGREVVTIHLDDAGEPDQGLSQAERLVERDNVHLIVGPLFAHVGLAVSEYASRQGVPIFHPVVSADDLTQRERMDGVLRVGGWTSSQTTHPYGEWAYEQGYERVVTLCSDYAFGHEQCGGFANTFTDAGGEIVEQLWNPLDTADFGPYIGQIQDADPDAVFVLQVGGDSVRFVESWSEFGMKDQIPLLGGETLLDQSLLRGMDPGAAEGLMSVGKFAEGRDDPVTQDFVESFEEAYDLIPSYYASTCFQAAEWTALALEEIGGDIEDQDAFLEAVRGLEFESAGGPMSLDEYDNPIQNVYVREVVQRDDGLLWNVPVETFEDVSQFWTFDPDEFLAQPVYSREYQGID
jgi:branched-chain amino acid transport system substrate-binding protein